MLTIPLQCFLNDKNIFHIDFTRSLTFQWKLLVMAKHGELFASKILVLCSATYYSAMLITCTQTRIHRTQSIHYDKSLKRSSLRHIVTTNFTATIYRLLCEILLQRSLTRMISGRDNAKIVPISRWFIVSMRCFDDISVINHERSEQNAFFIDYCLRYMYFCTVL